jgi:hypothetical protein
MLLPVIVAEDPAVRHLVVWCGGRRCAELEEACEALTLKLAATERALAASEQRNGDTAAKHAKVAS